MGLLNENKIELWANEQGYDINLVKNYLEYLKKQNQKNEVFFQDKETKNTINSYGFLEYCRKINCYPYIVLSSHFSFYEEEYLGAGCLVFREGESKFFKIYVDSQGNYNMFARDFKNENNRMVFETDANDLLYFPLQNLFYKIQKIDFKETSLSIEKTKKGYDLVLLNKNESNYIDVLIGEESYKFFDSIHSFYNDLESVSDICINEDIIQKVLTRNS